MGKLTAVAEGSRGAARMGRPRCAGSTASAITARGRAGARHDLLTRLGSNLRFSSGRGCAGDGPEGPMARVRRTGE